MPILALLPISFNYEKPRIGDSFEKRKLWLYVLFYRLWVCYKTPADNPEAQQLRYINLVPKHSRPSQKPEFENVVATIERFNERIANQPIKGIRLR